MRNRRRQKDLGVKLAQIESEHNKVMKKRYSTLLETFYQMRLQRKALEDVQYFSKEDWRQRNGK